MTQTVKMKDPFSPAVYISFTGPFSRIHRPPGGYYQRNYILSLVYNSTTPLSAVFVCGFKFTRRQLDRKTFEVDKWVSLEFSTRQ